MNIEIRLMRPEDIPSLEEIVVRIYPNEAKVLATLKKDLPDMFSKAYTRPTFFVAVADKTVVGVVGMMEAVISFNNAYQLNWLIVDPLFQKKGVAKKLAEHLRDELKSIGAKYALITVDDPSFAIKYGFKQIDVLNDECIMSLHL